MLTHVRLSVPGHSMSAITGYRRGLDLANGVVFASYQHAGTAHRREVYASHPDEVVIIRLIADGPETLTGSVTVEGTHGETATGDAASLTAGFNAVLDNGLKYAAVVTAGSVGGTVSVSGGSVAFAGCSQVVIAVAAGTNYTPDVRKNFFEPTSDPRSIAVGRARAAVRVPGDALLATHVADFRSLSDTMSINLGTSSGAQRAHGHLGAVAGAGGERGDAGPGVGSELPAVRALSDDHGVAGRVAVELAGALAGDQQSGLDERLPHRHQHRDELLAHGQGRAFSLF